MSELTDKLRRPDTEIEWTGSGGLMDLAADEIERLSAEVSDLEVTVKRLKNDDFFLKTILLGIERT